MTENGIEFRKAGLNDIEAIQEIDYITWPVTFCPAVRVSEDL